MTGLTDEGVKINREKYGSNILMDSKNNSFWKLLLESLSDPIIKILLIALGIKTIFLIKNFDWYETVGIVIAIFIASFISTISEYGSEQAFKRMQEESSKIKTKVIRNNKIKEINVEEVVVNDIVVLETGDKIPADGILIDGNISVDESLLTGESKEKNKTKNDELYMGTVVYSKKAKMLVKKVGKNTMYGNVANELKTKSPDSPLKIRLTALATKISKIGYIGAILVSFTYLFSKIVIQNNFNIPAIIETITNFPVLIGHILYALTLSVTIIVVAVPEGLPMMITLVLSTNMRKMLKNNVLVRKLMGIETAGNINVLLTDKTGTLTKGKLEVTNFIDGNLNFYGKLNTIDNEIKKILIDSILYNNSSEYGKDKIVGGNSTDRALLKYIGYNIKKYEILETIPFDSKNKYMETTIKKDRKIKLIKGAPEKILPMCTSYYSKMGTKKNLYNKKEIINIIDSLAKKGNRLIVVAQSYDLDQNNYCLVGIMVLKDEIRKEAIEGIRLVKNAHINTIMITGDNKNTAEAIGEELGMLEKDSIVITSEELNKLSDENLKQIFPRIKIVARALPKDKTKLVRIARELDLVVGMTGDGVNDAPALKQADVGFAMGSGTEVAKEAADIVILDDNFLSISKAILFGRTIFKSIRKFIVFQLTVNMCAICLSIIGPFIGVETPITVIQMLWVNMVMDTLAGLAFSFEPPLIEYMNELPKKKNEQIINKYMLTEIFITGSYLTILCISFLKIPFFKSLFRENVQDIYFMTAFFGLFIFTCLFNSFNARTTRINIFANLLKNKIFLFIIFFIVVVQLILIYYGGNLFRTAGLTISELLLIFCISFTIIPIDWVRKYILKKKNMTTII